MLGLFYKPVSEYGVFPFAVEDYLTFEDADPNSFCGAVQIEDSTEDYEIIAFFEMCKAANCGLVILGYEFLSDDIGSEQGDSDYFDKLLSFARKVGYVEIENVYEDRIVFRRER